MDAIFFRKTILVIFTLLSFNLSAQTPRINFRQVIKDTLTGSIVLSGGDSSMVYSRDFYISADSSLILYGDTVGNLSSILVDGITILGDGINTNLSVDTNLVKDIIGKFVDSGLGIDVEYDTTNKILLIESLSIEDSVYNGTGSPITKGTPLYAIGTQGNYWSVAPADASDINKLPVIAIAGEEILDGQEGVALIKGHIKQVNTEGFADGDEVYLAVGGGYTNVKPKGNNIYAQRLGTVIKGGSTNGSGIINLGEPFEGLSPNKIFIGGTDSVITTINLQDSLDSKLSIVSTDLTLTGQGTSGDVLKVDTTVIATLSALNDSLSGIITTVSTDLTLTGDGTSGDPLKVDTTIIATIGALTDSLSGIISTISTDNTLTGDGSGGNPLKVDTTIIGTKADLDLKMNLDFSNVTDTLQVSNGGTGATSFTAGQMLKGNGTSAIQAASNLREDADTVYVDKFLNVDTATLYVNANSNRVGIGTSTPSQTVEINLDNSGVNNRFFIQPVPTTDAQHAFGGINNNLNGYKFSADTVSVFFLIDVFGSKSGLGDIGIGGDYQFLAVTNRDFSSGGNDIYQQGAMQISNLNSDGGYGYISFGSEYFNTYVPQRIGINTVNPTQSLDVNGTVRVRTVNSGAYSTPVNRTSDGTLTTSTSDLRLKTNLQPLENTLNKLLGINTYTFNWINETDRVDLGMIAQEVEEVFPLLTFTNQADGYKGIHYNRFSIILTKAIQEQQAIIESQATEIEQLKTQIQLILNEIEQIKNK